MTTPTERAQKRRRFFRDDLDECISQTINPVLEHNSSSDLMSLDPPSPAQDHQLVKAPALFSEQLMTVIGEELSPKAIQSLQDVSGGNVERAVNMFFDGSWSQEQGPDKSPRGLITTSSGAVPPTPTLNSFITKYTTPTNIPRNRSLSPSPPEQWSRKYIGSFGVEGWAIASGTNLLKAGDSLVIERQNPRAVACKPPTSKTTHAPLKAKVPAPPSRIPFQPKQGQQHILVRFTTLSGREIGRLPQETANFVSTLLDQNICHFDGVCIFAPDRIRTGDNILIQLRCYLLPQCFRPMTASKEDRPGVWEVSETEAERNLKLRRVGLLQLFNAIGLEPSKTNDPNRATAGARDQLLVAAQLPEPNAKEKDKSPSMSRSSSSQSTPDEDDGEKEVAEDTLNLLYKKAQMYDPDMPTMDPPSTFKFELRKYQKQALCWMVGKESGGENEVRKSESLNPLWEEYIWSEDETTTGKENLSSTDGQSEEEKFYMNPYSGEMSLTLPTQESMHKGGILADGTSPASPFHKSFVPQMFTVEMGLGKTIEMLSLIHTVRAPPSTKNKSTLVIAPMSIISQWKSEADNSSSHTLRTQIYYGSDKSLDLPSLCTSPSAPDVIVTSYGVVLSEWQSP